MKIEEQILMKNWIASHNEIGLILPDGWFGRPNDNILKFVAFQMDADKLRIELEEQLLLSFVGNLQISEEEDGRNLAIGKFTECIFKRKEFGSNIFREKKYVEGVVRFVSTD